MENPNANIIANLAKQAKLDIDVIEKIYSDLGITTEEQGRLRLGEILELIKAAQRSTFVDSGLGLSGDQKSEKRKFDKDLIDDSAALEDGDEGESTSSLLNKKLKTEDKTEDVTEGSILVTPENVFQQLSSCSINEAIALTSRFSKNPEFLSQLAELASSNELPELARLCDPKHRENMAFDYANVGATRPEELDTGLRLELLLGTPLQRWDERSPQKKLRANGKSGGGTVTEEQLKDASDDEGVKGDWSNEDGTVKYDGCSPGKNINEMLFTIRLQKPGILKRLKQQKSDPKEGDKEVIDGVTYQWKEVNGTFGWSVGKLINKFASGIKSFKPSILKHLTRVGKDPGDENSKGYVIVDLNGLNLDEKQVRIVVKTINKCILELKDACFAGVIVLYNGAMKTYEPRVEVKLEDLK